MIKGQLSFDFILVISIFVIVSGVIIGFVNDFETNNSLITENMQNYNVYLYSQDYILGAKSYDDFSVDKTFPVFDKCDIDVDPNTNKLTLGIPEDDFVVNLPSNRTQLNVYCGNIVVGKAVVP